MPADRGNWISWSVLFAVLGLPGCRHCEPTCIPAYWGREAAFPLDVTLQPGVRFDVPGAATPADPSTMVPRPVPYGAEVRAMSGSPVQPAGWATGGALQPDAPREIPEPLPPRPTPLELPREFPGAAAPPIQLPSQQPGQLDGERREAIANLYPALPQGPLIVEPRPGPDGRPLTLDVLQQLAADNSPVLRQAAADVEAARGRMIQAGLYPNPRLGYEADTVNTLRTPGYHGAYVQQELVTGGKLRLARAAAEREVANAELALRRAHIEVGTAVRSAYFALLVARERFKLARAFARFTDQIYRAQVDLASGGEAAAYEPMQVRVFAWQARAAEARSRNEYLAAWRRLAAAMGLPDMPPTQTAGQVDGEIPAVEYETVLALMLSRHTDLGIAQNDIEQSRLLLQLARVTPLPNLDVTTVVQRDYTFEPGTYTYNLLLGGELPVFDRNQGNIVAAQAALFRAEQTVPQVRNELTAKLAAAFARYQAGRIIAQSFAQDALEDQVRVYRGVYERYRNDPANVEFNDVVVAQQLLGTTLTQYVDVLGEQWQALVEVAQVVQVDDLFLLGQGVHVAPLPRLEEVGAGEGAAGS